MRHDEKLSPAGQLWAVRLHWANVVGGVNCRGPHDPDDNRSGLNVSYYVGDDAHRVAANRRRILQSMGAQDWPVVTAGQVHGSHVVTVHEDMQPGFDPSAAGMRSPQTDGLVTQQPHVVLNLMFADCVPILLYCAEPLTVGVLHAGWRGTAARIAEKGVGAMCALGAKPTAIHAVIGPAICGKCYEVGPEVLEALSLLPGPGKALLELPRNHVSLAEANRQLLLHCELPEEAIHTSQLCTRCGDVPMFSYRAAGGGTGLHGAFIALARDPH